MRIEDLMDLEMYGSMYILFAMASFYVEGANLLVPSRVNFNFKEFFRLSHPSLKDSSAQGDGLLWPSGPPDLKENGNN